MKFKYVGLLAFASVVAFSGNASANAVYDFTLGLQVTGTITTDGNIGILTSADIIDYNITILTTNFSDNLTGPLSGGNSVSFTDPTTTAFTATSAGLFFDFAATNAGGHSQYLGFAGGNGFTSLLCFNGAAASCSGNPSAIFILVHGQQAAVVESGNVEIATLAGAVPEPSTWAMMLLGFAGLGYMGFRQRKRMIAT